MRFSTLILGAAMLAACSTVGTQATPEANLEISACDIDDLPVAAECGRIFVYENRDARSGRKIPIEFVRIRASGPDRSPFPIVNLDGGPGQNSTESAAGHFVNSGAVANHDQIVFDQRGTGRSNGLDCIRYDLDAAPDAFREMFEDRFFDPEKYKACLAALESKADLRFYTTSRIADDVDDLRAALGYEKIILDGDSYGTTLGLEIMRRHGENVHAAIFRGVSPSFSLQTATLARDTETMLEELFEACEEDADCNRNHPQFRNDLAAVLARVRESPVDVVLPHTLTGEPTEVRLNYPQLVTAIRYALYSTHFSATLPDAIGLAKDGDYRTVSALLPQLLYLLANVASEGMWASVRCAEEFPYLNVAEARTLAAGTMIGEERIDSGLAICAFWPRGNIPKNFHDPVVSSVPSLLFAGEVDAATPPQLAIDAVKYLKNGKLVLIPNASHWELSNACTDDIAAAFLVDPAAPVDDSCVKETRRPPFGLNEDD